MTTNAITLDAVCRTPSESDDRYRCPICSRPKEFHAGYYVELQRIFPTTTSGQGRAVLLPISIESINLDCLSEHETVGTDCAKKIPATHKVSVAAAVKEIERRERLELERDLRSAGRREAIAIQRELRTEAERVAFMGKQLGELANLYANRVVGDGEVYPADVLAMKTWRDEVVATTTKIGNAIDCLLDDCVAARDADD